MNARPIIIENATIPDFTNFAWEHGTIMVLDGVITQDPDTIPSDAISIDAKSNPVLPAFVDMRAHLFAPPHIHTEEPYITLSAATAGGYCAVASSPCAPDPVTDTNTLSLIRESVRHSPCKLAISASVTDLNGNICDLEAMFAAGAHFAADDGYAGLETLIKAAKICKKQGKLLICRPSSPLLSRTAAARDEYRAYESAKTAQICAIAKSTGAKIHISGISTADSVKVIKAAKSSGAAITCDTSVAYLTMCSSDAMFYGTSAKLDPPLGSRSDREALIAAACDGTVDAISSDHTPVENSRKALPYNAASCGMISLQTVFSSAVTALVAPGKMSLIRLAQMMSTSPAAILGISPNAAVICDIDSPFTLTEDMLCKKPSVSNSPYIGQVLRGKIEKVVY